MPAECYQAEGANGAKRRASCPVGWEACRLVPDLDCTALFMIQIKYTVTVRDREQLKELLLDIKAVYLLSQRNCIQTEFERGKARTAGAAAYNRTKRPVDINHNIMGSRTIAIVAGRKCRSDGTARIPKRFYRKQRTEWCVVRENEQAGKLALAGPEYMPQWGKRRLWPRGLGSNRSIITKARMLDTESYQIVHL